MNTSRADRAEALAAALRILDIADTAAVVEDLELAADTLNAYLLAEKVSLKTLAARLADIETMSAELADLIEQYDAGLFAAIGTRSRELQSPYSVGDELDIATLRRLSADAGAARGAAVLELGSGDADNPDPNGADLATKLDGSPKRRFVSEIVGILAVQRPDLLATTKEGPLHRFVVDCWEWAIGDQNPPGIPDDIAIVVPEFQSIRDRAAARELATAARNFRRLGLPQYAADFQAQADKITERIAIRSRGRN
ncbi:MULTISPECIES: hypothetical protein [unclassified Mesorhizobium]|uniref:hypothetical protein n=1 Tax=unclassified Mesorhizobium TaxID=325217 RepID=UPI0003CE2CDD|nr:MULTISPECIES: hypothetical protein [unclassified Mesorhizobium]ESY16284.1 hypothetical protein X751_21640 [Mesorhizobium sp. LNJC395A00]WJI76590.1 hypothetical protein NLY37_07770 [Mesorhizobium sp. C395A]